MTYFPAQEHLPQSAQINRNRVSASERAASMSGLMQRAWASSDGRRIISRIGPMRLRLQSCLPVCRHASRNNAAYITCTAFSTINPQHPEGTVCNFCDRVQQRIRANARQINSESSLIHFGMSGVKLGPLVGATAKDIAAIERVSNRSVA